MPFALVRWCVRALGSPLSPLGHLFSAGGPSFFAILTTQRRNFFSTLEVGMISWLRRVRLENPLGHGNFLSGLKLSGERDGGLGLARFSAVCPLGGHMYANGL